MPSIDTSWQWDGTRLNSGEWVSVIPSTRTRWQLSKTTMRGRAGLGRAGRAGGHGAGGFVGVVGEAADDQVFLAREVLEEGALGHLGRGGDLIDADGVEAGGEEQARGRVLDCLAGALGLALPQAGMICHASQGTPS